MSTSEATRKVSDWKAEETSYSRAELARLLLSHRLYLAAGCALGEW